ncbi:MAG: TatD family hydrolase [Nanohaloarchaea archaeon]|nr:TatD family hydrolase [Candidatus Nanohaloarchaea archaeon]
MKPVDCHCHLDFEQYKDDREKVVERARDNLEFVINAGSNLKHNGKALELQAKYEGFVYANLGLHPTYTEDFDQLEEIKKKIRDEDPIAIGEIGLDHHHVEDDAIRERQEEVFRGMLQLAEELEKPIVVHTRDAEKKSVEIIEEYDIENVMLHCFNGKPDLAKRAAKNGWKIGVTTQVLYSARVQNIVEKLSLESILLETDSPFLYRGERNEPANVKESVEKISEIKDLEETEVHERTTSSAKKFFGLEG